MVIAWGRRGPLNVVPTAPFGLDSPPRSRPTRARGPRGRTTSVARHTTLKAEDAAACLGHLPARLPLGAGLVVLAHLLSLRRPPLIVVPPLWMSMGDRLVVPVTPPGGTIVPCPGAPPQE